MKNRMERKANRGKSTIFGYDINKMSPTTQILTLLGVFGLLAFIFWFLIKKVTKEPDKSAKKKKKPKKN